MVCYESRLTLEIFLLRLSTFSDLDFLHFSRMSVAKYKALNKQIFFAKSKVGFMQREKYNKFFL